MKCSNNIDMKIEKEWKNRSKLYLSELQKFLDKAENISDEELKKEIIIQMLKCDEILTELAEEKFQELYEQEKND